LKSSLSLIRAIRVNTWASSYYRFSEIRKYGDSGRHHEKTAPITCRTYPKRRMPTQCLLISQKYMTTTRYEMEQLSITVVPAVVFHFSGISSKQ